MWVERIEPTMTMYVNERPDMLCCQLFCWRIQPKWIDSPTRMFDSYQNIWCQQHRCCGSVTWFVVAPMYIRCLVFSLDASIELHRNMNLQRTSQKPDSAHFKRVKEIERNQVPVPVPSVRDVNKILGARWSTLRSNQRSRLGKDANTRNSIIVLKLISSAMNRSNMASLSSLLEFYILGMLGLVSEENWV